MTQCGPDRQYWQIHCTRVLSDFIMLNECAQAFAMAGVDDIAA